MGHVCIAGTHLCYHSRMNFSAVLCPEMGGSRNRYALPSKQSHGSSSSWGPTVTVNRHLWLCRAHYWKYRGQ
jgi:hypothetical protein